MKKIMLLSAVAFFALTAWKINNEHPTLAIGAEAPEQSYEMMGIDEKNHTLQSLKKEKGLLVIFSCNTCPFVVGRKEKGVEGWQGRYNNLHKLADRLKIGVVLVNSNEAKREGDDSFEKMKEHAYDNKYLSPYVVDKNSFLADAFGAKTTPHVFLFNKDLKLAYKGAIDDNVNKEKDVKNKYLMDAMYKMVDGKPIVPTETDALGCSIKRVKVSE